MKKTTKVWILTLSALVLVAATVTGTLAYLTDRDSVENTFTVGKVEITVDEAKVDTNGVADPSGERVKQNSYHLIPGQTYTKDPTMTVLSGSEKSYVRMIVTIDHYEQLTEIFSDPFLPQYFVTGWDNDVWTSTGKIKVDETANTGTYEFRYYTAVTPGDQDLVLEPLFETLTMPGEVTGEELATIADLKITVVGHAIQEIGFDTEDQAWEAFDAQVKD